MALPAETADKRLLPAVFEKQAVHLPSGSYRRPPHALRTEQNIPGSRSAVQKDPLLPHCGRNRYIPPCSVSEEWRAYGCVPPSGKLRCLLPRGSSLPRKAAAPAFPPTPAACSGRLHRCAVLRFCAAHSCAPTPAPAPPLPLRPPSTKASMRYPPLPCGRQHSGEGRSHSPE